MENQETTPQGYITRDQFAQRCGIVLEHVAPGQARARMAIEAHHLNGHGSVHGGALFTLADYVFAAACNSHQHLSVGINMNLTCLRAVSEGTLIADAREVAEPRRLSGCAVEIRDGQGELVAIFQGLAYNKKE
jgi:acyl-CoA thioesterase